MKKATALIAAVGILLAPAAFAASTVRISQVYGGNGNTYNQDYVELFNSSGSPVDISGWSLQYGSATGTTNLGACTNCLTVFPSGSIIPACGYYLIGLALSTTAGAALPVTPDLNIAPASANNLSSTNGKIALKADGTTTACSPQTAFVDLVGYGSANCSEGAAAGVLTGTQGLVRNNDGMDDSDVNSADLTVVTAPVPRNSASPINPLCTPVSVEQNSWSNVKVRYKD